MTTKSSRAKPPRRRGAPAHIRSHEPSPFCPSTGRKAYGDNADDRRRDPPARPVLQARGPRLPHLDRMPLPRHAGAEQLLITCAARSAAALLHATSTFSCNSASDLSSGRAHPSLPLDFASATASVSAKRIGLAQGPDQGGGLNQVLPSLGGVPRPFLRDDELMGSVPGRLRHRHRHPQNEVFLCVNPSVRNAQCYRQEAGIPSVTATLHPTTAVVISPP